MEATVSTKGSGQEHGNQPNRDEKYVVIVKNAENNVATIHRHALPRFLNLQSSALADAPHPAESPFYCLSVRTETRSAQLDFFYPVGFPPDGAESIFNASQKHTANGEPKAKKARHEEREAGEASAEVTEGIAQNESDGRRVHVIHNAAELARRYDGANYFASIPQFHLCDSAEPRVSQSTLVTAEADSSAPLSQKQMRTLLGDLPGFLDCWRLHAVGPQNRRYRLLFASVRSLFQGKALLDEFSLSGGVKLAVALPDSLTEAFANYIVERAGTDQGLDDVPASEPAKKRSRKSQQSPHL